MMDTLKIFFYEREKMFIRIYFSEEKFTFLQLAAQAFIFFVGGFETTATTIQFTLYELSKNQEIQKKLRNEIKRVLAKHNGQVTYEAVYEMEYMGRVMDG